MSFLDDLKSSLAKEFDAGDPDTNRKVMFEVRKRRGQSEDAPMADSMRQAYRTPQAIGAVLGRTPDADFKAARQQQGIDFDVSTPGKKVGTALGALGADIAQDSGRAFWWLINAPQAAANIVGEAAVAKARPDLYDVDPKTKKAKYGRGAKALMLAPAGLAINAGVGLMNPLGGDEGYKAIVPSADDPSKTDNVLAEVATKYILGRSGNLLPYDEFVKVRPDVSKDEYGQYKAYLHDKRVDLNPFDDGEVVLPAGVAKLNTDGIHGPEAQFLGKTLSLTETGIPFAGAVLGAATGARLGGEKPVRRGAMGGAAGLAAGTIIGNLVENERRRRNAAANELGA